MRILIIGAGCTGLLVAQGLRKQGIEATVFERSSVDRRPRDWTMMVHWGADFIQDLLPEDIFEHFRDAETDPWTEVETGKPGDRPVWNGKTGELHASIKGVMFKRYSRKRLCQILSRGIDIKFDKELTDVRILETDCVEAVFADGSVEKGDVLLGADSANSRVRSWLFDDAPFAKTTDLPLIVYNFSASYPDAEFARRLRDHPHPLMKMATHPDHLTWYLIAPLEVADLNRPEEWSFQHFLTHWSDDNAPSRDSRERLAHFKRIGATYAEPFRSATAQIDDSTLIPHDRLKHWAEPKLWDNRQGRVTLAGDAAHPFPPHRAQGLNNGIQDAAHFVRLVGDHAHTIGTQEFAVAVAAYDEEMFERGTREMVASVKQAYDATHMSQFASSMVVTHGHTRLPDEASAH